MQDPWWKYLLDALMSANTGQDLERAGATPEEARLGLTGGLEIPSFHTEPAPPPGLRESRDLAHAHPELVRRYELLKAAFRERVGRELFETCTYRCAERQHELYLQGRRGVPGERMVTHIDGLSKRSRHQRWPSEAVDVAVDIDPGPGKHVVWDPESYAPIGPLAAEFGLVWGGDWGMKDYPHLELPAGIA